MTSPYLSTREAAEYLRMSVNGVHGALRDGVIPRWCVCKRGRRLLFDTRSLDEWLRGKEDVKKLRKAG